MNSETRNRIVQDYVAAFARHGSRPYIRNLETAVSLHQWGEHALPLTVNHGERGETFVCSPRALYIDYALEELANFPKPAAIPAIRALIRGLGGILSLCDINRIVHINNWMLSTNLPVCLDPGLARQQTESLAAAYPAHVLAMRSLTWRHNADMMRALQAAGWALLPARQVFLVDDIERQSMPHRDTRRDDKLWRNGAFAYEEPAEISMADAARIAQLYEMLYVQKHSGLNPHFSADFIALSHRTGVIRYLVLRDEAGTIQAFGGMHHLGDHGTMPLLGYDMSADRQLGLYRLAFHAGSLYAMRHKLLFNMSSGATAFKRNRGAVAEMEFTAFYLRHLPASRRCPFNILGAVAQNIAMPVLRKYQL